MNFSYELPFRKTDNIIELGGGTTPIIRPNVDFRPGPTVDVLADLGEKLPLDSDMYDGVYSAYVIEHVGWRRVRTFIKEIYRILKKGGRAVILAPNLLEQARVLVEKEVWDDKDVCMIFGDQDYIPGNVHMNGFSPEYAFRLFREAGFSDIFILPHPNTVTDMVIEAVKNEVHAEPAFVSTPALRKEMFSRDYFDGGKGKWGGYAREGYWDYPVHFLTAQKILDKKPESVLEIGCARGYVLKKLEDTGLRVKGLEISEHCALTRVIKDVVTWDITEIPWPVKDKEFDLCVSVATLEHIPESFIPLVLKEIVRVSNRGFHGVDFGGHDDGFDKTHCTLRDKSWWISQCNAVDSNFDWGIVDKEEMEKGQIPLPPDDGKIKLNLGSFTTMFHYGWVNIDQHNLYDWARSYGFKYRQHDLRMGIPYAVGSVDLIYACHFLEHLTYEEGRNFLSECYRTLKPGGTMRLIMPDAELLTKKYHEGKLGEYDELNEGCSRNPYQAGKLWELLFSGHRSMYDRMSAMDAIRKAGFSNVNVYGFRESGVPQILKETLDMYPTLSLFMEAVK